jgi:uncharacterized protein
LKYIDTNIFIRYLTRDDEVKAHRCRELFERLDRNDEEVMTCEAVIAEVVFVLSSPRWYGLKADKVVSLLRPILEFRGLRVPGKSRCIRALEIYAARPALGFEDSLIAAHMEAESIEEIYSYDSGFDRVPGIARLEPAPA